MKTLIKILHTIDGYELHYRVFGSDKVSIEFVERPCFKGGK